MNKPSRSRQSSVQPSARLGAYLAAGLGASTIGTAQSAIVFFDVNPAKTIGVAGTPTPNQTLSFTDINIGAGTYNSSIGYGPPVYSGLSLWFTITGENQFTAQSAGMSLSSSVNFPAPDNLRNFSAGQAIDGSSKYTVGPIAGWNSSGTGYVGLVFRDALATADNFGWLELDYVANGASTTLTVGGFAFEDQPGVAIAAGDTGSTAVPEPGTWAAAALLAGGAAFARWRKRRDEAQKEAA